MNLAQELTRCWNLNSLPKEKWNKEEACISIGNFRFFYWYNTGCSSDEIRVLIVHPDGESLKIIHKLYGSSGIRQTWECWKSGNWDQALSEAYNLIKEANDIKQAELDMIRAQNIQQSQQLKLEKIRKFEELFK